MFRNGVVGKSIHKHGEHYLGGKIPKSRNDKGTNERIEKAWHKVWDSIVRR